MRPAKRQPTPTTKTQSTAQGSQVGVEPAWCRAAEARRAELEARRKRAFEGRFGWTLAFWLWLLAIHLTGIYLFTSGFLLTRLVLDDQSECLHPPIEPLQQWPGQGSVDAGCWHPKTFEKAVVIVIDALRYDFTVPVEDASVAQVFHNAFPFLHQTSLESPNNAVLLPFIADPPTATLQRLKGLTTGTLPTFIDLGSSFGGTAIEEDNLLMQLREAGKRIVHLGDDTWTALFPGYFQQNISRAYDSFNVWDLHTVDNGVLEHIFPLMKPDRRGEWDFLIGHLLGVDHAGHRYGPSHAAMTAKLQQMDLFIRDLVQTMDDDTLLVVMGDHGMDAKGDHGGESDDEVEAALWMYSTRPLFGRTKEEFVSPPATAKVRPVNQIDLVPTLALLLGLPIPYNNLGRPIEEAFAGSEGNDWSNLAAASRMTAAGIRNYQASYFKARGMEHDSGPASAAGLWDKASALFQGSSSEEQWKAAHGAYSLFQEETLRICKGLWARFDISRMLQGVAVMASAVILLLGYVSRDEDDNVAIVEDAELDAVERRLELLAGTTGDHPAPPPFQPLNRSIVLSASVGALLGAVLALGYVTSTGSDGWSTIAAVASFASMLGAARSLVRGGKGLAGLLPDNVWGWLSVLFTLCQSIGFASNSYTIWEDSISLFFLTTFGLVSALAALRQGTMAERTLGVYHSLLFTLLGRFASFSKLCREEQMPYCTSTYYASANSSTSAAWQLAIPFTVSLLLPSIVKSYLASSRSYQGLAPAWIGYGFRASLFLAAVYWLLDAADNGNWMPASVVAEEGFKMIRVAVAQTVLGLAFIVGGVAYIWAPPCVSILTSATGGGKAQVTVLGYGNAHGARYLLLVLNWVGACFLLSKPMGGGAVAVMLWQILSLAEMLDLNALTGETIGPVILAILGNFHFFKTGHQAALASIQWDSAFIPLLALRYPWSPLVVAVNTFAGQIVGCVAVPLVVVWKTSPRRRGVLEAVSRALAVFVAYFAVESVATMMWAGHLRRHLMLYRIFSPRFMLASAVLIVVDVVAILVTLPGLRISALAVGEVFGWAD